jgi:hypothetical protein
VNPTRLLWAGLTVLLFVSSAFAASALDRQRGLQQRQLEDTLSLNLLQGAPRARADLSPTDALRLDQLQLRQRMEQQQLEQQQLQLERLNRNRPDRDAQLHQRVFAQERENQLQRFDLEQRELLSTMKPAPLQRPLPNGQLSP